MTKKQLIPFHSIDEANSLFDLRNEFDKIFRSFLGEESCKGLSPRSNYFSPNINVSETEEAFHITAELPGIEEKEISLNISDNMLHIEGKKDIEKDEKNRNYHIIERHHGHFKRSIRVPFRLEENSVQALFENGVLQIDISKPKEQKQKQIPIRKK